MTVAPRSRGRSPHAALLSPLAGLVALALTACGGDGPAGPPGPDAGTVQVSAATTGDDPDPDGYTVTLDGGDARSLDPDGTATFEDVGEGEHELALSDVADNCAVDGASTRTVAVSAGATASTGFDVGCQRIEKLLFASGRSGGFDIWRRPRTARARPGSPMPRGRISGRAGRPTAPGSPS